MKRLRPRWPFDRSGSVRARSARTSAAGAERAPGLHPVDHVAGLAVRTGRRGCGDLQVGDVAAEVGFGHGDRRHHFGGSKLREPGQLLLFGATGDEGAGQDLRPRDERTADPEARTAELFGCDDHAEVLGVAALAEAAVLGRHAEPEGADLGETGHDLLGDIAVRSVNVLGMRCDHVGGERAERVADHVHVVVEVARAWCLGQRCQEFRVPIRLDIGTGLGECVGLNAPQCLAADQFGGQVVHCVGDEAAGEPSLDVTLAAVVEHRASRRDAGCGVRELVREDLLGVGSTELGEPGDRGAENLVGDLDHPRGGGQVGSSRWGGDRLGHVSKLPLGKSLRKPRSGSTAARRAHTFGRSTCRHPS